MQLSTVARLDLSEVKRLKVFPEARHTADTADAAASKGASCRSAPSFSEDNGGVGVENVCCGGLNLNPDIVGYVLCCSSVDVALPLGCRQELFCGLTPAELDWLQNDVEARPAFGALFFSLVIYTTLLAGSCAEARSSKAPLAAYQTASGIRPRCVREGLPRKH